MGRLFFCGNGNVEPLKILRQRRRTNFSGIEKYGFKERAF